VRNVSFASITLLLAIILRLSDVLVCACVARHRRRQSLLRVGTHTNANGLTKVQADIFNCRHVV
jgi:hypothetical protein